MALGDFTVTALYDGFIDLDMALLKNVTPAELNRSLGRAFQRPPKVQTAVNAYLVHTGTQLVLIDTGTAKAFGPDLGFVVDNLKAAGYTPEQVDLVLITHMHPDHVNGLLTADGKVAFPNARVMVASKESEYWLSEATAKAAPKDEQPFFAMARQAAAPYRAANRWLALDEKAPIVPGITAVPLPGHTPGHTVFQVESREQRMLVVGDMLHVHAAQLANPGVAIGFDTDSPKAVANRTTLLRRAANERAWIASAHLPFPGIGRMRAEGQGYAWVPVEFGPLR